MEMRACEGTEMSQDLTPPIRPIAAALHDPFLRSHCSSCFRPMLNPQTAPAISANDHPTPEPSPLSCCGASLRHCSGECRSADLESHVSSGECQLICLVQIHHSQISTWLLDDTTDLRAALRLLHSFEKLGFLSSRNGSGRIGGLLASKRDRLEEGCEMSERIREGGVLMSRARKLLRAETSEGGGGIGEGGGGGAGEVEEAVLWVVLTNAVEVQVGEGRPLGVAVYGPRFSWFNHSCSPNACYRFELAWSGLPDSGEPSSRVSPAGRGQEEEATTMTWMSDENKLNQELCRYGPRIIVRSIRPIKKGEEICITYTDLLQPKALRHLDLWAKYRFVCCCERCSASPEAYVDYILRENGFNLNATHLNSDHNNQRDGTCEELANILDQAESEYLSVGNPEACSEKIEIMLSESFQGEQIQPDEVPRTKSKLQPLHHLSLKSYIMLASIYRIRTSSIETFDSSEEDIVSGASDASRAAAAYSLLLAGATHHLFSSESSLIATAALFWISAGESLLVFIRNSLRGSAFQLINPSKLSSVFRERESSSMSQEEFKATSASFLNCISRISPKVWPLLVPGSQCLNYIKSPVDFSWLGKANVSPQAPGTSQCYSKEEEKCIGCRCETEICIEEDGRELTRLAVHGLIYGGYLATICYGCRCCSVDHVRNLLCGWREPSP